MRHGSFFSGIGGFDYAAELMGWENIFHCEINAFGQKVLRHYWPNAVSYEDITKSDFSIHRGQIDIVTGGFPCQPYSVAGKRKGKEDERHLWPEMLRAIREISPTWVVGENVLGLVSWNGGLVFDEVQTDLEAAGYEVQPFILPAASVGAPHKRDRVWFVAHANGTASATGNYERGEHKPLDRSEIRAIDCASCSPTTYTGKERLPNAEQIRELGWKRSRIDSIGNMWEKFPTQSPVCNGDDGLSSRLDPTSVFDGGKSRNGNHFTKWRNESIAAGGNAIVPPVALQIFKAIQQYENSLHSSPDRR